ncbi:MAG TPA: TonB-dependent receptor plug domain-containing protein [Opitutaceae bacterium]|nr:TonB-dependent receptor plug domain-containing protein [Opitutaceae bacterium]
MKSDQPLWTLRGIPASLRQSSSRRLAAYLAAAMCAAATGSHAHAQTAPGINDAQKPDDETIYLSPFEVSAEASDEGYGAATTLAGNRLNTQLRDVGSSVSVITTRFLNDTAATNNASLLQYTLGTEVGGSRGNFAGTGDAQRLTEQTIRPNENTRVRGLAAADNTRDFFRTEIPWDAYNVDRVDLQRGPNSILFGQGSPAGIINTATRGAIFNNHREAEFRFGSYGSNRQSVDLNQVLVDKQVALRIDALRNDEKFQQDPAFSRDERLSGAIRVEPEFLKKNGMRTIFKANFETGHIDSNNPRQLPPTDNITPWLTDLKQATYSGMQLWDHLSGRINHGQARDAGYAAPNSGPIPYFSPWIANANFGTSGAGTEPISFFGGNGAPSQWITEVSAGLQSNGIGPDGKPDSNVGGFVAAPGRMRGINGTALWAAESKLPYSAAGIHKDNLLTDPSIFDFYNNLIDGDTKREWQRFHSATFNLTQTFWDEQAGVSLDYNKEHYESGQVALLGGNVGLFIDPMAVFADGTPDAGKDGDPFSDGTKNPNVGRPFVSSTGGNNNSFTSDRKVSRATGFLTHDFGKDGNVWLKRILGTQTLTGLLADDQQKTDSRTWQRYGYITDNTAYAIEHLDPANFAFNSPGMVPTSIVYLGGSLLGKSAQGAKIPGVSGNPTIASGAVRYFDDHWAKPTDPSAPGYVDPGAPWINYFYTGDPSKLAPGQPGNPAGMMSTQSENPANYVGWTTAQLNVTDSEAALGNRDKLTTAASLRKSATTSQALVWQGKMIDNALVFTYGWRRDVNKSWALDKQVSTARFLADGITPNPDYKRIDFNSYELPGAPSGRVEVQSRAYSIVGHLFDLPGVKSFTKNLPFEISLSYNVSTNFKPDSSRVDILGVPLASPSGKTIDRGILIETRNGRYSMRINRYETWNKNASGSSLIGFDIGNWMGHGANFANVFEYDIGNFEWVKTAANYQQGDPQRYNFRNADGSWDTTGEAAAIAAFREFQKKVDPRFWSAWGYTSLQHVQSGQAIPIPGEVHVPAGFTVTEDSVSRGWEIELNAEPITNWRLTLNASKSDAVRYNIGGENMRTLMNLISDTIKGPAGQLHFWWGTADVPRAKDTWYNYLNNPGAQWVSRTLLEGSEVPELREWHVNVISNYDFTHGILNGVNFGGGVRYQSPVVIGYPPLGNPNDPADYSVDLNNPYKGPAETYLDLWVGYSRKLGKRVRWHIQANVQNAFQHDELIPITAQGPIPGQPAGTPAAYRIAPTQTFVITNKFEF